MMIASGCPSSVGSTSRQRAGPRTKHAVEYASASTPRAASTVTLAGALNVVVTNEIPTDVAFVIINNVGGAAVGGTFSGKPNNSIFAASQYNWRISYTGGSGNDVTLTALSSVLTPPNAPLNLTATPASWRQIDLSWTDNSANEAGFVVERSLSAGGPFVAVGNVAANITSFADTTCAELTTYYYRVRAFRDFASLSPSSNIATATTPLMPLIGYQAVITITNYTRSEGLTNFPALVVLGTNVPGFDYNTFLAPTPDELRFKAADGTTDLDYEVETWDTAGQSFVWVKIPVLTNNCPIVARWGNPNITDPPASEGTGAVWSNGFLGFDPPYCNQKTGTCVREPADCSRTGSSCLTRPCCEGDLFSVCETSNPNSVFRYADTFAAYAFNPLIAGNQWEKGIRPIAGQHLLEGNKHVRDWAQRYSLERPPTAAPPARSRSTRPRPGPG
mgnify:CR=1 FL=1